MKIYPQTMMNGKRGELVLSHHDRIVAMSIATSLPCKDFDAQRKRGRFMRALCGDGFDFDEWNEILSVEERKERLRDTVTIPISRTEATIVKRACETFVNEASTTKRADGQTMQGIGGNIASALEAIRVSLCAVLGVDAYPDDDEETGEPILAPNPVRAVRAEQEVTHGVE